MRWRLSLLMFLLYAVPGAWVPVFTVHLKELEFTPVAMGWCCAGSALASLVAPLVAGQVADRWVSSERCIGCCSLAGGVLMWLLAELHGPLAVFVCCVAFWLVMQPVLTLGASLCFAHLPAPEREFGRVRLWGTIGWVAPNLFLGYWRDEPDWALMLLGWLRPETPVAVWADSQRLAGLLAFALAAYALTLPHTPPAHRGTSWLAPAAALRQLRSWTFAVFVVCSIGLCITIPFSAQLTPLLLEALGVPARWLTPTLSIAQSMEIVSLGLLPALLLHLGLRGTMVLGLVAWSAALGVLALGTPPWLVIGSLALNGICVCCFLVAGQVFVHRRSSADSRASAQGLLTFLNGVGLLIGNVLVGGVRELTGDEFGPTFATAAGLAAALVVVFVIGFTERARAPAAEVAAEVMS